MRLCVISLGGESSKKIAEEAKEFFDEVLEINLKNIELCVDNKGFFVKNGSERLEDFDCVYIRGSHRSALLQRALTRALYKKVYMPIRPNAFTLGHNKLLCSLELQQKGISVPTTYFVLNAKQAKSLLGELHYPVIIKVPEGAQGKGVMFADSEGSARSMIDALDVLRQPYIIQEYIETGERSSEDIRVVVAGGKVVGSMKRISKSSDVRANIHASGRGEEYILNAELEKMAVKAARVIGVDIAAVDILKGRKSFVLEVNLSPGLKGIAKYTGKNIAKEVARALYKKTVEFKELLVNKGGSKKQVVDENGFDEHYVEAHVEKGKLTLPRFISHGSKLVNGDDLIIKLRNGEVRILRHNIKKEDD
jgi:ribosomal protein S6--L-glutamate ligase